MKLDDLIRRMESAATDMRELLAKSKSAEADEKKNQYRAAYDAKREQFEELKGEFEEAKALADVDKLVSEARTAGAADQRGKSLNPEGQPGDARVEVKTDEHAAKADAFFRWMKRGPNALSGNEMKAIEGDQRVDGSEDGRVVKVPARMAHNVTCKTGQQSFGKASDILSSGTSEYATDAGGANLVPDNYIAQVLEYPVDIPSYADQCTRVPAARGKWEYPMLDQSNAGDFGGVSFSYQSTEGSAKTETNPYFTNFTGTTFELAGLTQVSNIMLSRSAVQLEAYLTGLFRRAIRHKLSYDVKHGAGTTEPEGLLTNASISTVNREVASQVSYADLINLEYEVSKSLRMGAQFIMVDGAEKYLKQQTDNDGRPLFTSDTSQGIRNRLIGYPYATDEFSSSGSPVVDLGDVGDVIFGNLAHYALGIEQDVQIAFSDDYAFDKALRTYRVIIFWGGKTIHPSAFAKLIAATG